MKKSMASLATISLAISGVLVSPAFADESAPTPRPSALGPVTDGPVAPVDQPRRVLVMLKDQPQGKGDEKAGLAAVNRVIDRWKDSEGFSIRRKFGSLVKAFSATLPESKIDALAADPDVASVKVLKVFYPLQQTSGELTKSVSARKKFDVDGSGMVVSVIDTGIDPTHRDMRLDAGAARKLSPEGSKTTDKVPYGWNYADDNANFVDTTSSMHGMHVAGIVAANGGPDANVETNGRINGIAPNAQLLSMKVFSNNPEFSGAQEDDIIAAIEDSVKHGADVINMSLGSPNGTDQASVGEGRAIANAQAAGVQVIVAAGNEGLNGSAGDTTDLTDMLDDGTVGSPSTASEALSVASVNNIQSIASAAETIVAGNREKIAYQLQAGKIDDQEHTLVFGGLGKPDDLPDSVNGNYVLISRGEITFAEKFTNAVAKGATGVLVYNSEAGGDAFQGMSGIGGFGIPGGFLYKSVGDKLAQQIQDNGGEIKIKLTKDALAVPLGDLALAPSNFTSWGTGPELNFKPQLAGIGGSVYSTYNGDTYGNSSGTSMATPHVAGAFALGVQEYKEKFPNLSANERNDLLRISLSNTAKILEHEGIPYAPRQIGAGLIQTEDALSTNVFATVDSAPTVALREVKEAKTFTVTLTNKGDKEYTFTTGSTCGVAESQSAGAENVTTCDDAEQASAAAAEVTVPAGGNSTVDFTVTPKAGANHWLQGWVKLTSKDPTQPSLALPYLGFAGEWNAEPIIDPADGSPFYDDFFGPDQPNKSQLLTSGVFGGQPTSWLSPNGDGISDDIHPQLMFLRSASDVEFEIVKDGKVLLQLGNARDLQRRTLPSISTAVLGSAQTFSGNDWDGYIYNAEDDTFVPAPEGDAQSYVYRVRARLSKDFEWQTYDFPFGLDATEPEVAMEVEVNADGSRDYTVKVTDTGSGIDPAAMTAINLHDSKELELTKVDDSTYTFSVNAEQAKQDSFAVFSVADQAGNVSSVTDYYGKAPLKVVNEEQFNHWVGSSSSPSQISHIEDNAATVNFAVTDQVDRVSVNGEPVELEDGMGSAKVKLTDNAKTTITLVAQDANGAEVAKTELWLGLDYVPPTVEVLQAPVNDRGELVLDANGTATIKAKVTDNLSPHNEIAVLAGKGPSGQFNSPDVAADGTFSAVVKPADADRSVSILAADHYTDDSPGLVNLGVVSLPIEGRETEGSVSPYSIVFDDEALNVPGTQFGDRFYFLDAQNQNLEVVNDNATGDEIAAKFVLKGRWRKIPHTFRVQGKDVAIDAEGRFAIPIDLVNGITNIGYEVVEQDGDDVHESKWVFFYDRHLPGYSLTTDPVVAPNDAIYLATKPSEVNVKGQVWDTEFGYKFAVNGSVIREFENIRDPGRENNAQPYEMTVPVADKDNFLRLSLADLSGNGIERSIPLVVDNTAPVIAIEAPLAASPESVKGNVTDSYVFTVKASDEALKDVTVQLNGNTIASEQVTITAHPGAKVSTIIGGQPAPSQDVEESNSSGTARDAEEKTVTISVDLKGKEVVSGVNTLSVDASDLAGNRSAQAKTFVVDEKPVIEGPDSLELQVKGTPAEQIKAVIDAINAAYKATDTEDDKAGKPVELTFDASVIKIGQSFELTLVAVDSAGQRVERVVKVTAMKKVVPSDPGQGGDPNVPGPKPGQPGSPKPGKPGRPGLPKTGA